MSLAPFTLDLHLAETPYSGPFRLFLEADLEGDDEIVDEDYEAAQSLLALFVRAANAQLFRAGRDAPPASIEASVLAWHPSPAGCELAGTATNLPAHAWLILAALLNKNHLALEPLIAMRLDTIDGQPALPDSVLASWCDRSMDSDDLPFEFEGAGIDASENLSFDFEFERELDDEQFGWIENALYLWGEIVMLGGFDLEFTDDEDLGSGLGNVKRIARNRLRFDLPDYIGDTSGFESMLNLARFIDREILPIEALAFD